MAQYKVDVASNIPVKATVIVEAPNLRTAQNLVLEQVLKPDFLWRPTGKALPANTVVSLTKKL